jgi:hypothetical protein
VELFVQVSVVIADYMYEESVTPQEQNPQNRCRIPSSECVHSHPVRQVARREVHLRPADALPHEDCNWLCARRYGIEHSCGRHECEDFGSGTVDVEQQGMVVHYLPCWGE